MVGKSRNTNHLLSTSFSIPFLCHLFGDPFGDIYISRLCEYLPQNDSIFDLRIERVFLTQHQRFLAIRETRVLYSRKEDRMINKCVFEVDGVTSFLQRSNQQRRLLSRLFTNTPPFLPPSLILRAFKFSPRILYGSKYDKHRDRIFVKRISRRRRRETRKSRVKNFRDVRNHGKSAVKKTRRFDNRGKLLWEIAFRSREVAAGNPVE